MSKPNEMKRSVLAVTSLLVIGAVVISVIANERDNVDSNANEVVTITSTKTAAKSFPVIVRKPTGPPRVATDQVDAMGRPVTVSCASCHATREANLSTRDSKQLDEFHKGLTYKHAELSCMACHNADDYNTLRLADGSAVLHENVIQLCAQCHGPQTRDYLHGSHGGMTGYWDLSRGPRHRNNCIDCHDPHAPAYPVVKPVFPPKDRFQPHGATHHQRHEGD